MGWLTDELMCEKTPFTNADRIRAMSDEELADFLDKVNPRLWKHETWIKWLKQEVQNAELD